MTQILSDRSVGSSGEVLTADMPSDYTVTGLLITEKHVQVTDEATLAEKLASLDTVEITTRNGSPWKMTGVDLYYFNRDFYGMHPHIAGNSVATDNLIIYKTLGIPLNPMGVWNTQMGITPQTKGKIRLTMGTDTASGSDARTVTIAALGYENMYASEFLGAFADNFTAQVGDNFRDVQSDRVAGMMGIFNFGTTGIEDLTTTDAPGLKEIGWAVNKSVRERVRAHSIQLLTGAWNLPISPGEAVGLPSSDYHLLDTGLKQGAYVPYVDGLQAYINSGVAEAFRTHALLAVRNE
jgi:hypothetical protein